MRLTRLFGKTSREEPAEADSASHRLLLKAGMLQQTAAGVYSYMPLLWRSLRKIEQIIREEMDAAGGQEGAMPILQPLEIWQQTGRDVAFGHTLFIVTDRKDRKLVLGPTHEEIITDLVRRNVQSYRDLPLLLYQIQTKLRDEARPRGGLVRVREFTMKDAYSFHTDQDDLDVYYLRLVEAYKNIYRRCGLAWVMVEADSGAIGGKDSHEFMLVAESGEDTIISCNKCDYSANAEKAISLKRAMEKEEPLPLEEVSTPGVKSIPDLAKFLNIPESRTLKAVFYACDNRLVFVMIRGDLEVNEIKLKNALKCTDMRLATDEEARAAGIVPGFASPIGLKGVKIVADDSITLGANFVVGGNKPDVHLRNANFPRDFKVDLITDIALAQAGHTCPRCGDMFRSTRGIEVGHVFKLGTAFSQKLGALFLDKDGTQKPIVMGCYGIGLGRLLAAAVEQNHDELGIVWPAPIAPYQVHLCGLSMDNQQVAEAAGKLYAALQEAKIEVLFDDRAETPGVKFKDADLLGMPIRLTVSPRTMKSDSAELKLRRETGMKLVPLGDVVAQVKELLNTSVS